MNMHLEEWVVVIGGLLILVLLLNDHRRRRKEPDTMRVSLKKAPPVESPGDPDLRRDFPSGGARVVHRASTGGALTGKAFAESNETGNEAPDAWDSSPWADSPGLDTAAPVATSPPPAPAGIQEGTAPEEIQNTDASTRSGQNYDLLDDLNTGGWGQVKRPPPPGFEAEIFLLHIAAKERGGFEGAEILQILLAYGMRFGEMSFFHRHADVVGRGDILFSAANMFNPGVFDIDAMPALRTRGLSFFARLPGPPDSVRAVQLMIETAQGVSRDLNGELLDECRSAATPQTLEHLRQRVRDMERRLLAQSGR